MEVLDGEPRHHFSLRSERRSSTLTLNQIEEKPTGRDEDDGTETATRRTFRRISVSDLTSNRFSQDRSMTPKRIQPLSNLAEAPGKPHTTMVSGRSSGKSRDVAQRGENKRGSTEERGGAWIWRGRQWPSRSVERRRRGKRRSTGR